MGKLVGRFVCLFIATYLDWIFQEMSLHENGIVYTVQGVYLLIDFLNSIKKSVTYLTNSYSDSVLIRTWI